MTCKHTCEGCDGSECAREAPDEQEIVTIRVVCNNTRSLRGLSDQRRASQQRKIDKRAAQDDARDRITQEQALQHIRRLAMFDTCRVTGKAAPRPEDSADVKAALRAIWRLFPLDWDELHEEEW